MNANEIKKLIQARIDTFSAVLANPKTIKSKRAKADAARVALSLILRDIEFVESTHTGE